MDAEVLGFDKSSMVEVVAQTGVIGVMLFFLFRQMLSRAEKFDESASSRESRMANRVTELEKIISDEIMSLVRENAETKTQTIELLREIKVELPEAVKRSHEFQILAMRVLDRLNSHNPQEQ